MIKILSAFKFRSWTGLIPVLIVLVVFWVIANTSISKTYKEGIIAADAKGYYAYLPAVFIYHDLNFNFFYKTERVEYYNRNMYYDYRIEHNNKTSNRYYVGTAICLMPFFLIGHAITTLTGLPQDGYSYYYTLMAHLGAVFYLFLGLLLLRKLLRSYNFDEKTIAIVLIAIVFGTNLFYYVVTEFAMSHLYSFVAITGFCLAVRNYFKLPKAVTLVYIFLLLGIIAVIRPVNLLILLSIPFLADEPEKIGYGIKSLWINKYALLAGMGLFLLLVSLQLIIYKIQTGDYFVDSYQKYSFNFLHPEIINFLFSYRKGMFVYTPLLFVSMAGFIPLFRTSMYRFAMLFAFLFILIYVLSSWFMWFYGGSFSQRVMIDFYVFFSILLAAGLQKLRGHKMQKYFIALIVLVVLFCQVQTYQYRHMQIHWSDMNKEKYWDVFMKID